MSKDDQLFHLHVHATNQMNKLIGCMVQILAVIQQIHLYFVNFKCC